MYDMPKSAFINSLSDAGLLTASYLCCKYTEVVFHRLGTNRMLVTCKDALRDGVALTGFIIRPVRSGKNAGKWKFVECAVNLNLGGMTYA
jgi:hypothetical protein